MPNLASAKKRLRQNAGRRLRNQVAKTRIKNTIRKAVEAKAAIGTDEAKDAMRSIDKAAAKGIIHRNAAARKKSRLAKRLATVAA
jgi:small subunit ribosomal protein S20